MRVLIVEDERKLAGFLRRALREDGHAVDVCHDGIEGRHLALHEEYDAVVLDLMLPGINGIEIVRQMREASKPTPVLILTARDRVEDRVEGLDAGADDYMCKPFSLEEFRARIRALLRRGSASPGHVLRYGPITMDLLKRKVAVGKTPVHLTAREFSVLEFFLRNPERVLPRTTIAEHVWDYNFEWNSNVVDVFVNAVRRKLENAGARRIIRTLRGVGYTLSERE